VSFDLVVRGADAVLADRGVTSCDIAIKSGKIAGIFEPGTALSGEREMSARGLLMMPGALDVHLHLGHGKDIARPRVPGDAASETGAAAHGGITTFVTYVMSADPYEDFFDELKSVTEAGARIDFGFHFIIATRRQLASVPRYVRDFGVPTMKLFMNIRGSEGDRLGLPAIDDGFMFELLEQLHKSGGMMCPHPENIEVAWALGRRLREQDPDGKGGLTAWNASRPPFVEAEAIQRAGYLGQVAGAPVYFVHTSSEEALNAARSVRAKGADVYIETCNHYLTHDVSSELGDVAKINPPLRNATDREALWKGIADGSIDTVATDHVHRTTDFKKGGIWAASPGCPGLDSFLPIMISEGYHKRGLSLSRIAELTAHNPARIMGLSPAKGSLAIGSDADIAFVDLNAEYVFGPQFRATDANYSIYDGWKCKGRVVHTMSRGQFALRDGALTADGTGRGRYVPRSSPPVRR